jgi:hypothetical protein
MQDVDLDALIFQIRKRYDELEVIPSKRERFVDHLRSLGHWEQDPMDYPWPWLRYFFCNFLHYNFSGPWLGTKQVALGSDYSAGG